jgi:hypothetical protein
VLTDSTYGACAGSSAGLAPLKMRSTYEASAGRCPTYPVRTSPRSIRSTKAGLIAFAELAR